jgi:hypothetical protein
LAVAVKLGWMPWSITRASDVGMSYGALAVLGGLTAAIPRQYWPAWIAWWLSLSVCAALIGGEFTNAGHAVALMLGVLVGMRFRQPVQWTPVRFLMLVNSAGFGFLILAHSMWGMAAGVVLGVLGALIAHALGRRFMPGLQREDASEEMAAPPRPALMLATDTGK